MTTLANVKGYINGNEWGVYEPAPSLLTYEEIVAMAQAEGSPYTNALSELNSYAELYFDKYSGEGKLSTISTMMGNSYNNAFVVEGNPLPSAVLYYNNGSWSKGS